MNKAAVITTIIIALLLTAVSVFAIISIETGPGDCYTEAIELADSAVTTTDDFAAYTVNTLDRIMSGMPHNQSEMDRIASAHRSNTDTLADIQSRCGAF